MAESVKDRDDQFIALTLKQTIINLERKNVGHDTTTMCDWFYGSQSNGESITSMWRQMALVTDIRLYNEHTYLCWFVAIC